MNTPGSMPDKNTPPPHTHTQVSSNLIILGEYLKRYSPAETFASGVFIRTTADIISELSEMAELEPDEVNTFMILQGYRPGRNNSGAFGWMMHRSPL